jgi:prepilin-type N-terminal cleavage/methylation domain-containing protein
MSSGPVLRPARGRPGFTLVELVIAIAIAAILMAIMAPQFQRAQERRGAHAARDAVIRLAATSRMLAVERGRSVLMEIDPESRRAWAIAVGSADTLTLIDLQREFGAQVTTDGGKLTVCYNSRGYAIGACSVGLNNGAAVSFTRGPFEARAAVLPLGQVERQ